MAAESGLTPPLKGWKNCFIPQLQEPAMKPRKPAPATPEMNHRELIPDTPATTGTLTGWTGTEIKIGKIMPIVKTAMIMNILTGRSDITKNR